MKQDQVDRFIRIDPAEREVYINALRASAVHEQLYSQADPSNFFGVNRYATMHLSLQELIHAHSSAEFEKEVLE